ncbi:hypothetical protein ABIE44_001037 [Marmoricola sp. OAE513]|uniref:hypothetical protein n=1 Tax=Marmoricola sp. OAE513 TaxID=2817894 RepID=UPI001AE6ACE0
MSTSARTVVGLVVLLVLAAVGSVLFRSQDDEPATERLRIDWVGTEGHPGCTYDAASGTVTARLELDGSHVRARELTLTVTAYADENTSEAVGSRTQQVEIEGAVHRTITFSIPVGSPPHVGEDDVAACRREIG